MQRKNKINWTNESVLALADGNDPIEVVKNCARELVLKARERGWEGPPFNPLHIVEMLGVQVEANSSIADARLVSTEAGPKIEFNPRQPRERVRFSIAHEIAHLLFPDWNTQTRNRSSKNYVDDNWQLEMLCNLAASEFVLPIGSLAPLLSIPKIEDLMQQRRQYDVSAEAFLIRLAKVSTQPISVFFASPFHSEEDAREYRIDYVVSSPTAPYSDISAFQIPSDSVVKNCTAIGYTDSALENWISGVDTQVECVGIPAYPGKLYPRVAGLIRFDVSRSGLQPIRLVHGDVLDPRGDGKKIICQLVNDRATKWGGGVARKVSRRFPDAELAFAEHLFRIPQAERLGKTIFSQANEDITIASLIAQEGFGPSLFPRIRYSAIERCIKEVALRAIQDEATIHMPKIGTGAAGGNWGTIEEMLDDAMVRAGLSVTIYEPPPKRTQLELF